MKDISKSLKIAKIIFYKLDSKNKISVYWNNRTLFSLLNNEISINDTIEFYNYCVEEPKLFLLNKLKKFNKIYK